jgi:hypothetical protein
MHLSLPWLHLLSKGNHAHPRFNCSYILPLFTSAYKRSHFVFGFILHPFHITFLYSRNDPAFDSSYLGWVVCCLSFFHDYTSDKQGAIVLQREYCKLLILHYLHCVSHKNTLAILSLNSIANYSLEYIFMLEVFICIPELEACVKIKI